MRTYEEVREIFSEGELALTLVCHFSPEQIHQL